MIAIDDSAPTSEEHKQGAVFKCRYLKWRDENSSSFNLGFRVEGIKVAVNLKMLHHMYMYIRYVQNFIAGLLSSIEIYYVSIRKGILRLMFGLQ